MSRAPIAVTSEPEAVLGALLARYKPSTVADVNDIEEGQVGGELDEGQALVGLEEPEAPAEQSAEGEETRHSTPDDAGLQDVPTDALETSPAKASVP